MTCPFTAEQLEEAVFGDGELISRDAVEAHARECRLCGWELKWLDVEHRSFQARDRGDGAAVGLDSLWQGIESAIAEREEVVRSSPRSLAPVRGWQMFAGGFAAAAVLATVLGSALEFGAPAPLRAEHGAILAPAPAALHNSPAIAVLREAEAQYRIAIAAVEAEFEMRKAILPGHTVAAYGLALRSSADAIARAHESAGDDVDAQMRVLDAYATHLDAVQVAVADLDNLTDRVKP